MTDYKTIETKKLHKLIYKERGVRVKLRQLTHIKKIINSGCLLNLEFKKNQEELFNIFVKYSNVLEQIKALNKFFFDLIKTKKEYPKFRLTIKTHFALRTIFTLLNVSKNTAVYKNFDKKLLKKVNFDDFLKITKKIITGLEKLNSEIIDLEEWFNDKYNISLTEGGHLYFCPNCGRFIGEKFRRIKCFCGKNINEGRNTLRKEARYLKDEIYNFFTKGFWLEEAICEVLKQLSDKRYCGIDVLGRSGILHELDILTALDNKKIFLIAECKDTDIDLKDVMKLNVKNEEINSHISCIFTTEKVSDERILQFCKYYKVLIFDKVFNRKSRDILNKIKQEIDLIR
ncbi:MAG: hypothetical protein IB618_03040 [Candidatus Pacearchaeota archaeon]|nr:MAG: hypothetical protein IB618_03040 [Candidatus Pacearchaeota archaeon]